MRNGTPARRPIWKTWVLTDGAHITCDTIRHEGALWLVPGWNHATAEGWMWPERIVRPRRAPFLPIAHPECRWYLQPKVPMPILLGETGSDADFEAREEPYIPILVGGVQ